MWKQVVSVEATSNFAQTRFHAGFLPLWGEGGAFFLAKFPEDKLSGHQLPSSIALIIIVILYLCDNLIDICQDFKLSEERVMSASVYHCISVSSTWHIFGT